MSNTWRKFFHGLDAGGQVVRHRLRVGQLRLSLAPRGHEAAAGQPVPSVGVLTSRADPERASVAARPGAVRGGLLRGHESGPLRETEASGLLT
jgi:hypothetical protein